MGLWSASIACAVNQNNQITFRLSFHEMQGIKQVRTISVGLPPALFMMVRDPVEYEKRTKHELPAMRSMST